MRLEQRVVKLEAVNGCGDRQKVILLVDPTDEELKAAEAKADENQLCIVRFVVPANGGRHSEHTETQDMQR